MKMFIFKLFIIIFLLSNSICASKRKRPDLGPPIYEENEVQILTDGDWDENLLNFDVYLILFYTSDCNKTKSFMKHFESAAEFLIITQPYTPLAKVECSPGNKKTSGICSKISLRKLPIVRYFNFILFHLHNEQQSDHSADIRTYFNYIRKESEK